MIYVMNAAKISKENTNAKDVKAPIHMKMIMGTMNPQIMKTTMKDMSQQIYVMSAAKISKEKINAEDVLFLIQ